MSAPIPAILAEIYSYALKANSSFPGGTVRELIERIAELESILRAMIDDDAFADLCAGIGEEPSWLKHARAALAATETK